MPVHLTSYMEGRGRPGQSGPSDGNGRRSIYLNVRRNFLNPMFLAFDAPVPFSTMGRRNVSNVPAQALTLMNDPLVIREANLWAKRLMQDPARSTRERLSNLYLAAFSPPTNHARIPCKPGVPGHARSDLTGRSSVTPNPHSTRGPTSVTCLLI